MVSSGNLWEQEYRNRGISTSFKTTLSHSVRFLTEFFERRGQDIVGMRVLDCGCGSGRNAIPLAMMRCRVFAFDISQVALLQFQEKLSQARERVQNRTHILRASMAESLPFSDDCFDVVMDITTFDILLNKEEIETHRSELLRVLKPDGYFLYYDMETRDPYSLWLEEQGRVRQDGALVSPEPTPIPFRTYSYEEVIQIFQGFKPLESAIFRFDDMMFGQNHGRAILCILFQSQKPSSS